ncbi:hypothetical protein [Erythrobacter sp. R86502]|uniref:hypothetical protein n=1 Tax=Erythrobacter sp. R86502 TaxID=3093846 RepID=UPI0036D3622B
MTNTPLPAWAALESDADFTDPAAICAQAALFDRRIARRNRIERLAGLVQLPFWGALAGFFFWEGEALIGVSLLMIVGGIMLVMRNLSLFAGNLAPQPEQPCRMHLEAQYRRQLHALRRVPVWYIGPVVPGVFAFFAATAAGAARNVGWAAAVEGAAMPFAITFGIFAVVILLNRRAARAVADDLERIQHEA